MKKIIGFMTAMLMIVFALSCDIFPVTIADDSAETASGKVLVAGNISDKSFKYLDFKIDGDSIVFDLHAKDYVDNSLYVASCDEFECSKDEEAEKYIFKPKGNGKYVISFLESMPYEYTTFAFYFNYYIMLVEVHDGIVDIDADNMYYIKSDYSKGEHEPAVITSISNKTSCTMKGTSTNIAFGYIMSNMLDKSDYYFFYALSGKITNEEPAFLALKGFDKEGMFSPNYGSISNKVVDFTKYDFTKISSEKAPSKLFYMLIGTDGHPPVNESNIIGTETTDVIRTDFGKITKYSYDCNVYDWSDEYSKHSFSVYKTDSFRYIDIPENDINLDGEFGVADAVMLQKWLHGKGGMNDYNAYMADICKDGEIDVFDFCMLKKALVK